MAKGVTFVQAYIANGGNGTQAAITAGYSENGADVRAAELLGDRRVSDAIVKRRSDLAEKYELRTDRVLKATFARGSNNATPMVTQQAQPATVHDGQAVTFP